MSKQRVWGAVIHPIMGTPLKTAACKSLWIDLWLIDDHPPIWAIHHHSPKFGLWHTSPWAQRKPMSLSCGNYFLPMATQNRWHLRTTHRLLLQHGRSLHLPVQLHNCISAKFLWILDYAKCRNVKWTSWNCRLTFCTPVGLWPGKLPMVPSNRHRAAVGDTGCACCSFRSLKLRPPNAFLLRLLCRVLDLEQCAAWKPPPMQE